MFGFIPTKSLANKLKIRRSMFFDLVAGRVHLMVVFQTSRAEFPACAIVPTLVQHTADKAPAGSRL